jgi:hypothetical protein
MRIVLVAVKPWVLHKNVRHVEAKLAPAKSCVSTDKWLDTVHANRGGYFITFELAAPLVNDPPSLRHGRRHLHHVAAISSVILLNRHLRHAVIPPMKNRRARACPCVLLV